MTTQDWIGDALAAISVETDSDAKGALLEAMIRRLFSEVPGLALDDQDVMSAYQTEEIDLYFWNDREREGLHFLDCPLIIECKAWSRPVGGNELRYFATTLKDRGRSSGIFVALQGITGNPDRRTAAQYHLAQSMAEGQTVLVITANDIATLTDWRDLVRLLQRRLVDHVKRQVLAEDVMAHREATRSRKRTPRK